MKIEYLRLKNFKRFPLRDIEVFEEDFRSNRLIGIIGCNGSGKSSLLRELSPFPSNKEHFFNKGEKEVHITHNNNFYILKSFFSKEENIFNFICNNEELNVSNQITIQKELIKTHFNLTEEVFDLLLGNSNFCDLTNLQRKKLFNFLTNIDIDKFLDIYEKIKEEEKFENNSLKVYLNNFTVENNKLEDIKKLKLIETKKEVTNRLLTELIETRSNLKANLKKDDIDNNIKEFKDLDSKLSYLFSNYYTVFTSYPFNNLNSLYEDYVHRKNKIEKEIELLLTKLNEINKNINNLKVIQDADKDALIKDIKSKKDNISLALSNLVIFKNTEEDVDKLQEELLKVENALHIIIDELESNENKIYTVDKLKESKDKENFLSNHINKLNELILLEKGKLKHLEDYHLNVSIECPKCNHVFSPELAIKIKENIESSIDKLTKDKEAKEKELQEVKKYNEKANKYFYYLDSYNKIVTSSNILQELWNYIKTNDYLTKDPKKILSAINISYNDLRNIKLIKQLQQNIDTLTKMLESLDNQNKTNLIEYKKQYDLVEEELQAQIENKKELEYEMLNLEISRKLYNVYSKLISTYSNVKDKLLTTSISVLLEDVIDVIDTEITKLKAILIEYESYIRSYNNTLTLVNNYKEKIENTKKKLFVLDLILKELSPKNGLIAKIISEYLNSIIKFINKIIESIFEYNVKLNIIDAENSILDYKFKFIVENKIEINDINKASSGMKEIFNLSFKLVLYKLLKLDNYPLYLDEFGIRLDTVHKNKIHNLIFKFINDTTFSQIFLITHTDLGIFHYKDTKIVTLS